VSKFLKWWDPTNLAQTAHKGEGVASLIIKGLQVMLVMFGATILVPLQLGMSPQVTLFGMGVGTWIFLLITKGKSPMMMGSSFAFMIGAMGVIDAVNGPFAGNTYTDEQRLQFALGGMVAAGIVYLVFSIIVKFIGAKRFMKFLPHAVMGPTVVLIGIILAPHAINQFTTNWILGPLTLIIIIAVMIFGKGKMKAYPILIGLGVSYFVAVLMTLGGSTVDGQPLVNYQPILDARPFGLPPFLLPVFRLEAIIMLVPFALATVAENIADNVIISGEMTEALNKEGIKQEEDLVCKKPGLARLLFADGVQSMAMSAIGTPMNTTYSEVVGLLIIMGKKVGKAAFSSLVIAIAAGFAVLAGSSPWFAEVVRSIPVAIIGGASVMLYGMIASIGMRSVKEHVDLNVEKYLIIMAVMLVVGIGMRFGTPITVPIPFLDVAIRLDRMNLAVAIILGIILNAVLPNKNLEKTK